MEYPLIEEQLASIDQQLEKAVKEINWTSEGRQLNHTHCGTYFTYTGAWEYIESTRDRVRDLERRVRLAKANVEAMCTVMAKWSQAPLFVRKEDKKDCLLNLDVSWVDCCCVCVHCHPSLGPRGTRQVSLRSGLGRRCKTSPACGRKPGVLPSKPTHTGLDELCGVPG